MTEQAHEGGQPQIVGERLRQERVNRGIDLDDMASALKTTKATVERLEQGSWEFLGSVVYVRGYVRSYARLLGLDESDLLSGVDTAHEAEVVPIYVSGSGFPDFTRIIRFVTYVSATALLVLPIVWFVFQNRADDSIVFLPEAADTEDASSPVIAAIAPVTRRRTEALPIGALEPDASSEQASTASPLNDPESRTLDRSGVASVEPNEQDTGAGEGTSSTLELMLSGDAWVEVSTASGRQLEFSRLPAGTAKAYPLGDGLAVRLGNAGDVRVRVSGEPFALEPHMRNDVATFELPAPD